MIDLEGFDQLDGLITAAVGRALHDLAAAVPPGCGIVEVGSYRGMSTAFLAAAAQPGVPVYAVDPWEFVPVRVWCGHCEQPTRAQFEAQLAAVGLLDRVTVRQGRSTVVAAAYDGPPVGLLYIDGDHSAAALDADIAAWRPHLAGKAVVAVDDYAGTNNPDVKPVVDRVFDEVTVTADGRLAVMSVTADG